MSVLLIHDLAEFGTQRAQHVLMAPAGDERFRLDVVAFGCQRRGVAEDVVGVTEYSLGCRRRSWWRVELARQRDADRRRRHTDRGLRSARIETPKSGWDVVEEVRSGLNARGGKAPLQAALVKIIEHYPSKSKRDRKPAGPKEGQSDFFG